MQLIVGNVLSYKHIQYYNNEEVTWNYTMDWGEVSQAWLEQGQITPGHLG